MNITPEDCQKWLNNKNINPITNKKITTNGPIYKKFLKHCNNDENISIITKIKNLCNEQSKINQNSKDEYYYNKLKEFCNEVLNKYKTSPKVRFNDSISSNIINNEIDRYNKFRLLKDYFKKIKIKNNECIKLTDKEGKYILANNILLYKQIGAGVFGIVYKSKNINKEFSSIPNFVTKIQLSTQEFKNELIILKKIMELKDIIPLFPLIYNISICSNIIRDKGYPDVLSQAKKQYSKYTLILYELGIDDFKNFIFTHPNLNEQIWKNCYEQIFMAIFAYHSILNQNHNDTHYKNFIYRKITPGGCFCYKINGINYYIENLGYVWMIWDYGNSQKLTDSSDYSWINDYLLFFIYSIKRNLEIENSSFFNKIFIHKDRQFGYFPDFINIPKSILTLQDQLANHIYYKSFKKLSNFFNHFLKTSGDKALTEYKWFKELFDNNILFSKKPIGEIISTTIINNPDVFYYSEFKKL